MPRTPRNGLASAGIGSAGSGLSAPASSVRTTSGRPSSARGDLAQRLGLLVLVGQLRAVEEEELGAQQADALGAELHRLGRLGGRAQVGEDLHARAVAHGAGLVRALERRGAARGGALAALLAARSTSAAGSTSERPGVAVEQQRRALVDREHGVAEPDGGGQAERAGEDRGVRGDRAVGGGDPAHERRGRGRPPRRASAPRRGRCRARSGPARLLARDGGDDAAPDVEHVGRALAQQRLVERRGRARRPARRRRATRARRWRRPRSPPGRGRAAPRRRAAPGGRRRWPPRPRRRGRRPPRGRARSPRARRRCASSRRSRSRSGSSAARSGGGPDGAAEAARGPDGDAGRGRDAGEHVARRRAPGRGPTGAWATGAGVGGAPAGAMPSPKPSSASARSAVSASAACGPDAVTTSVSPKRAPSATTFVRLVARTGAPPPSLATRTSAS